MRPQLPLENNLKHSAVSSATSGERTPIIIDSVIDGDTLVISMLGKSEHVRLIGIDAPEKEPNAKAGFDSARLGMPLPKLLGLGRQAADEMSKMVSPGERGFVELDEGPRDKYGRLLGYIYTDKNTFLNEEMVKRGFASAMTIAPNERYSDIFKRLAQDARKHELGLWPSGAF